MTDREFNGRLTYGRDWLVELMREGLTPQQVLELGEVVDGLYRDMRALYDQPKART